MRRFRHLTSRHRAPSTNLTLGLLLALNAGAVNAGGFLVLQRYTSHMTGFASQLADGVILRDADLLLTAAGAIVAFTVGAATTAVLVNYARRQKLQSVYALPLLFEALLLFPFGLLGAVTLSWHTPFSLPATVLLLSFMMGLQNAVGSKTSGGSIRTTHMTGNITDLGMELGKVLYWNWQQSPGQPRVKGDWNRIRRTGGLLLAFVLGGLAGAAGFQSVGFVFVVPLAVLLFVLAWMPVKDDFTRRRESSTRPDASGSSRK